METGRHQITTRMVNRSSEELWLCFPLKHIFLNSDKYIQELSLGSLRVSIMNNCYYSAQEAGVNHECEAVEKTKWNKHETRQKLKRKLYKAQLLEAQHRTSLPSVLLSAPSSSLFFFIFLPFVNMYKEKEERGGGCRRRRRGCLGLDPVPVHPIKGILCSKPQSGNMCSDICLRECCDTAPRS